MIEVTTDPSRKLVRAVMSGMLTVEEVDTFSREKCRAIQSMGLGSGECLLLVVTEGELVQTQEVMRAFEQMVLHSPLKSKRIATVRAGALTKMQSRRIFKVRDDAAVFGTVEDAEDWLFS